MPGQYFDAETGLFYNKQRYYDPARGEYLTPDPLGTPDGPNGYSYVRYNPLKYVDPDGLILFAFDGTENTDDSFDISRAERQQLGNGLSNVVRFRDAYNDGAVNYISGVGTTHVDSRYGNITAPALDAAVNRTGTDRINRMLQYFVDTADATPDSESMNVDIIGFSRGAAQARDFSNLVTSSSRQSGTQKGQAVWTDGTYQQGGKLYYRYVDQQYFGQTGNRRYNCQLVNFRFMGLWDSVLSTNSGRSYNLAIPAQFSYVAQAVALNEYRLQPNATYDLAANRSYYNSTRVNLPGDKHWGGFPLESIGASSDAAGRVRVERGFIGAHADIGGGYPDSEGQLSLVALNWMAAQAQIAGVKMDSSRVAVIPTSNPIIHDPSNAIRWGNPVAAQGVRTADGTLFRPEDRQVRGAVRGNSARTMGFNNNSMTNADTHPFISYWDRDPNPRPAGVNTNDIVDTVNLRNRTGSVDMAGYTAWLRQNGYCFVGDSCASARAGNPP